MLYIAEPKYIPRIWGSLMVSGSETPIGEIWWIYHDGKASSILRNPSKNDLTTVSDLHESGKLPGTHVYPVLLKTLHTSDRLSVQVHPGSDGGNFCKEETWIVLDALEGTWMMGGLSINDRELFIELLQQDRAEEVLQRIYIAEGDVYHIPPGTIHALGPGLEILEVQSNCDITYRLYDWGRTGINGVSRELHIEKGIEAIDWSNGGRPVAAGVNGIIDAHALDADYRISDLSGKLKIDIPGGALFYLSSGSAMAAGGEIRFPACLVADMDGGRFELDGSGYVIEPGGS